MLEEFAGGLPGTRDHRRDPVATKRPTIRTA